MQSFSARLRSSDLRAAGTLSGKHLQRPSMIESALVEFLLPANHNTGLAVPASAIDAACWECFEGEITVVLLVLNRPHCVSV